MRGDSPGVTIQTYSLVAGTAAHNRLVLYGLEPEVWAVHDCTPSHVKTPDAGVLPGRVCAAIAQLYPDAFTVGGHSGPQ